jgi:hypothetical protein
MKKIIFNSDDAILFISSDVKDPPCNIKQKILFGVDFESIPEEESKNFNIRGICQENEDFESLLYDISVEVSHNEDYFHIDILSHAKLDLALALSI